MLRVSRETLSTCRDCGRRRWGCRWRLAGCRAIAHLTAAGDNRQCSRNQGETGTTMIKHGYLGRNRL